MCWVIVVDAGRSRSTNLGRDAYILIIAWISSWVFEVLSIAQQWFVHPPLCYFSREKPLVKPTGPGSLSHIIWLCDLLLFAFISRSIKPKIKKYLAAIYSYLFYLAFDLSIYYNFIHVRLPILGRRYPKGIDNPFYTSGCEYLLFVCRGCLRCGAWFSYWFDNLGLITEGNTYCRCADHPFLFGEIPT